MALRNFPKYVMDDGPAEVDSVDSGSSDKPPRTYFPETWLWNAAKSGCVVLHEKNQKKSLNKHLIT